MTMHLTPQDQATLFDKPRTRRSKNSQFEDLYAAQCRQLQLPNVIRQFQFAKPRRFSADFFFPDYDLLIEIQGGIWRGGGGAHSHPLNLERDVEKHQLAVLLGFYVLPFTTDQVKSKHAIEFTQRVLYQSGWRPKP